MKEELEKWFKSINDEKDMYKLRVKLLDLYNFMIWLNNEVAQK